MRLTVVVTLEAAEGKEDQILAIAQRGKNVALAQDGCEGFEILQGKDETKRLMLIERWSSVEKHQPHFQKNVLETGVLDSLSALLASDIQ